MAVIIISVLTEVCGDKRQTL